MSEFREMVEAQRRTGGFLPEKSPLDLSPPDKEVHAPLDDDADNKEELMLTLLETSVPRSPLHAQKLDVQCRGGLDVRQAAQACCPCFSRCDREGYKAT